jgi:hypothetical protein
MGGGGCDSLIAGRIYRGGVKENVGDKLKNAPSYKASVTRFSE